MKKFRSILLKWMGEEKYLSFLATTFQRLYKTGRLGKEYQDIYFLKKYIRPGDHCIDIGAHLGYYTFQLSKLVGREGKVIAIEPVSKFHSVIQKLISRKKIKNITLIQVALGGATDVVEIGIPTINKQKKFGYARIRQLSEQFEYAESEKVNNANGDELFSNESRIDFIKCDVEGAEVPVFKSMIKVLEKHMPVLLCELVDINERIKLYNLLKSVNYKIYILKNNRLHDIGENFGEQANSHNYYFIPESRLSNFKELIRE